jgi:hypothetical protein
MHAEARWSRRDVLMLVRLREHVHREKRDLAK